MSVREEIGPNLARDNDVAERARRATPVLEEVVGNSGVDVKASWESGTDDEGRPVVQLQLSDFSGRVNAAFTPQEMAVLPHMRRRLHWLWGDLLLDRARRQVNEAILLGSADGEAR